MTIASNNDDDINGLDEPQDACHELLAPTTEGTQFAVAGLRRLIDDLRLRMAVAKQAGDKALAHDLKMNIEALYVAIAEQTHVYLNWRDRGRAHKFSELMGPSLVDEEFAAANDEAEAFAASVAAEEDGVEEVEYELAVTCTRIAALEKRLRNLECDDTAERIARQALAIAEDGGE